MTPKKKTSRVKKSYLQSKQAAKLENQEKLQVYIAGENRAIIERALTLQGHGTLSGFCAIAAIKEAKRVIAEHERKSATSGA